MLDATYPMPHPSGAREVASAIARDVMRTDAPTVAPKDSLARAVRLMERGGTREIPVLDGRHLVGILTRTDLEPYRGHFEWTPVRLAMTEDPVTVGPDTPLRDVIPSLVERGFNSVPVTTDGRLLGMIARTDVLRVLAPPS